MADHDPKRRAEAQRTNEPSARTTPVREAHRQASYTSPPEDGRSLGDLFKELTRETQMLVRQEIQLAKTEAADKASEAGRHVGMLAAGGFVAYAGFIVLAIAIGLLLGTFMPDWLGLAIASVAVLIAGYALVRSGLSGLRQVDLTLEKTSKTLQEDTLWMKQEAQDVKRDPKHLGADER